MMRGAALVALLGVGHPIHSSSAAITLAVGARAASVVLRVYADDFPPGREFSGVKRYLAERFRILDRRGNPLALHLEGIRAEGLVLIVDLSVPTPEGLAGLKVWDGVLVERFGDQVNLVQARYAGRSASLLFTATDGPKSLP